VEEHNLRVIEKSVLRRISGSTREESAIGWKRLHNVGFRNLYASPNFISVIKSGDG